MEFQYFDIHTHKDKTAANFSIINIYPEEIGTVMNNKFYSLGLHPWEIQNVNITDQIKTVEINISKKNILAVGEIGLDKFKPDLKKQKEVFLKQIEIAKNIKKPIIIHCVKAYSELLEILKSEQLTIPVIIHRYSANKAIARQLLKFNCFLSFGHELFNTDSKTENVFKNIPVNNIFLETDDSYLTIKQIYRKASDIKKIDAEDLKMTIRQNFIHCFGEIFN